MEEWRDKEAKVGKRKTIINKIKKMEVCRNEENSIEEVWKSEKERKYGGIAENGTRHKKRWKRRGRNGKSIKEDGIKEVLNEGEKKYGRTGKEHETWKKKNRKKTTRIKWKLKETKKTG